MIDSPEESANVAQRHDTVESDFGGKFEQHRAKNDALLSGVERRDIMASAERILHKYILPGAKHELKIPDRIAFDIQVEVQEKITNQGRDNPEVFEQAKVYIFQAMEGHNPSFLREKTLGNLSTSGCCWPRIHHHA